MHASGESRYGAGSLFKAKKKKKDMDMAAMDTNVEPKSFTPVDGVGVNMSEQGGGETTEKQ